LVDAHETIKNLAGSKWIDTQALRFFGQKFRYFLFDFRAHLVRLHSGL